MKKMMPNKIAKYSCLLLCGSGAITVAAAAAVPFEARMKQILLEHAYERGVEKGAPEKPWASADMKVIGKLRHKRLGESSVILSSGSIEAMRAGPTLVPGSADIGAPGTSVIAAHRDTHFAFLEHVKAGDVIEAAGADGRMRSYRVTGTEIVEDDDFMIAVGGDKNTLALSTCYPFDGMRGGSLRYVVHARL